MKGPFFICRDCVVANRSSFQVEGRTVYQMQVDGFAFSHTFTTNDQNEAQLWPGIGAEVHLEAKMVPVKNQTGCFKLAMPMFRDARVEAMAKKSANTAA